MSRASVAQEAERGIGAGSRQPQLLGAHTGTQHSPCKGRIASGWRRGCRTGALGKQSPRSTPPAAVLLPVPPPLLLLLHVPAPQCNDDLDQQPPKKSVQDSTAELSTGQDSG